MILYIPLLSADRPSPQQGNIKTLSLHCPSHPATNSQHNTEEMSDQRFSLKWNNYQSQLVQAFENLLDSNDLVDVTLGVEGKKLSAHKMLLSACSPYFRELLRDNPCQHPIIVLRDIPYDDVSCLLSFMYHGEVSVSQDSLNSFLKSAESLKIKGLTEENQEEEKKESSHQSTQSMKRPLPPTNNLEQQSPPAKVQRGNNVVKEEIVEFSDEIANAASQSTEDYEDIVDEDHHDMVGHDNPGQFIYSQDILWTSEIYDSLTCPLCGKAFKGRSALADHKAFHEGRTTCIHCNKICSTMANLRRHIATHTNNIAANEMI